MGTISLPAPRSALPTASRRILALLADDRLVEQIRRGNEAAFDVVWERHSPGILSFCRHMLGSREEAEDAVQHTFASAYQDLLRSDRPITLKAWLYTIARNRCFSVLRSRRPGRAEEEWDAPTAALDEQVQRRADLRELLRDLRDLPHDQRAALLLTEAGDLSHGEVAGVLGCEVPKVKALVFRARTGLIERREARDTPCEEIREQLANLHGGSLRRSELRHHLRACTGCRSFREDLRRQRAMLALVLPVAPSIHLKSSVMAAVGFGGGPAGGGAAAGGGIAAGGVTAGGGSVAGGGAAVGGGAVAGAGAGGGLGLAAAVPVVSSTVAKVAIAGVLAAGGAVAGKAVLEHARPFRALEDRGAPAVRDVGSGGVLESPAGLLGVAGGQAGLPTVLTPLLSAVPAGTGSLPDGSHGSLPGDGAQPSGDSGAPTSEPAPEPGTSEPPPGPGTSDPAPERGTSEPSPGPATSEAAPGPATSEPPSAETAPPEEPGIPIVTDPAAEPPLSDNAVKCPHKKDSADQSESSASKSADTKKKDEEGKDKCGESEPAATPIGGPGP